MSKKRGRPATKPEEKPEEKPPQTDTPDTDAPQDAPATDVPETKGSKAAPKAAAPPDPPKLMRGLVMLAGRKFGVPDWLLYLVLWTGSKYGEAPRATHNFTGLKAGQDQPKNAAGYAWFGNPKLGLARAAVTIGQATGGKYDDPAKTVAALAPHFPHIKDTDYTLFTGGK